MSLNLTITTGGSRGDLQPCLALATGLKDAGHNLRIATHYNYEGFVRSRGMDFSPVSGDPASDMRELTATSQGRGMVSFASQNARNFRHKLAHMLEDYRDTCRRADAVIYDYPGFLGYLVARASGLPSVGAFVEPLAAPTASFHSPLMPDLPARLPLGSLRKGYNRFSHVFARQLFWQFLRPMVNSALRTRLNAEPLPVRGLFKQAEEEGEPAIFGFSPSVLAPPPDWNDNRRITGYWFLDTEENWQPPAELEHFLSEGTPPVYITLGSIVERDPEAVTTLLIEALKESGQRAVLQSGWSGLGKADLPEDVVTVGEIPYGWLFPRVSAVVHHAGAGTTADALRAGVPSVTVPSFHSQPFWATTVAGLGAATSPIPRRELTAPRLADALQQVTTSPEMAATARALSARIAQEDGVLAAVSAIEEHARA